MTNLERAIGNLREEIETMMELVRAQLERTKQAFYELDQGLAEEIRHFENHVNAKEIAIDQNCENIIALYNPVAVDLRFVLASLQTSLHLERIGDHADGIAAFIQKGFIHSPFDPELLETIGFDQMFDTAVEMVDDATRGFLLEDTKMVRQVFRKDSALNKVRKKAAGHIAAHCAKNPEQLEDNLFLFSVIGKLERIGDLTKNIAEETVFFVEAKVLKHKKKKEKLKT